MCKRKFSVEDNVNLEVLNTLHRRKLSFFSKTLFESKEIWKRLLCVLVWTENILKRCFIFFEHKPKMTGKCCVFISPTALCSVDGGHVYKACKKKLGGVFWTPLSLLSVLIQVTPPVDFRRRLQRNGVREFTISFQQCAWVSHIISNG